ncbi:restriction endonuclease subunit S [bacterium]|nr:restriction endonuclease subunit S [bacterium]MBU1152479.1 restriction endonuclease subunit S [bacterium]MBU1781931.1 restriction endonuclease subunit S [bacterium]
MKNNCEKYSLEDVLIISGGGTPSTKNPEYWNGDIPFLVPTDVTGQKCKYMERTSNYITDLGLKKSSAKINPPGSILLTSRATIGECVINRVPMVTNQGFINIQAKKDKVDTEYFFYWIKNNRDHLISLGRGAVYLELVKSVFRKIEIELPSLSTQRKIASILSAYDNLIELNERRIKILEEMARLIYKEWFVKFRFPGYEKVRMVESELGRIPEGWEATNLGTVLDSIESGSRPKGGAEGFSPDGIPSIGAESIFGLGKFDFNKTKYISKSFFGNMRSGLIKNGDVLLYKDGACIGRKTYFDEDFPFKTCCINEHVFILRVNKRISQKYLFFWIDQLWVTQEIINLNSNSAQPGINKPSVKTLPILIPNHEIVTLFDEIVTPIIKMLFTCCKQNIALRQTRDMLLPRLIEGKIDV